MTEPSVIASNGPPTTRCCPHGCADHVPVQITALVAGVREDEQAEQSGGAAGKGEDHDCGYRRANPAGLLVARVSAREEAWPWLVHHLLVSAEVAVEEGVDAGGDGRGEFVGGRRGVVGRQSG